jgi:hypothetical protein
MAREKLYKEGASVMVHNIDKPSWLKAGWSADKEVAVKYAKAQKSKTEEAKAKADKIKAKADKLKAKAAKTKEAAKDK